jgi:hypothetical protein
MPLALFVGAVSVLACSALVVYVVNEITREHYAPPPPVPIPALKAWYVRRRQHDRGRR